MLAATTLLADSPASLIAPGSEVKKLAGEMQFIEGPVWLPNEKKLVFSDIPAGKLMQWSEADGLSLYRDCEQANGNILDLEGRIISCQHGARNIVRQEADGKITVLADKFDGKRFNSPNDVAVRIRRNALVHRSTLGPDRTARTARSLGLQTRS